MDSKRVCILSQTTTERKRERERERKREGEKKGKQDGRERESERERQQQRVRHACGFLSGLIDRTTTAKAKMSMTIDPETA